MDIKSEILDTIQLPLQYPELLAAGLRRSGKLQGLNLALAILLNASSFLQKASRNCHHLLLLASENKSFSYQPNYATHHKLYCKQFRS